MAGIPFDCMGQAVANDTFKLRRWRKDLREAIYPVWALWRAFGEKVAWYQALIALTAVYFLVLGPTALLAKARKNQAPVSPLTYWEEHTPVAVEDHEYYYRQY